MSGYIGNFNTKIESEGRIKKIPHGAAIIATGAEEYKPTEYLYGENENVVTSVELESMIVGQDERLKNCQSLVMIQCVGCRNEERNYCSRVCCGHSIKNALELRAMNPDMDIYILYRDMRSYGFKEDFIVKPRKRTSALCVTPWMTSLKWKPSRKVAAKCFR